MSGKNNKKTNEKDYKDLIKSGNESEVVENDGEKIDAADEQENSLTDTDDETKVSDDTEAVANDDTEASGKSDDIIDESTEDSGDSDSIMDESAEISEEDEKEMGIPKTESVEVTAGNKKKVIVLLLLVLVLLALVAAFVGIKASNEKKAASESEDIEDSSVIIFKVEASEVESFSYDIGGTVYTLEKTDDKWSDPDNPDLEIDSSAVESMLSGVKEVTTSQIITDEMTQEESSEYGFDNPIFELDIFYSDKTANILTVGNTNPMMNLDYATVNNNARLLTIDPTIRATFVPTNQLVVQDETDSDGNTTLSMEDLLK